MLNVEKKPKSFFWDKWYIREDLFTEQFQKDRHITNCNIMYQIGNCFDTQEKAIAKCNEIRLLLNLTLI